MSIFYNLFLYILIFKKNSNTKKPMAKNLGRPWCLKGRVWEVRGKFQNICLFLCNINWQQEQQKLASSRSNNSNKILKHWLMFTLRTTAAFTKTFLYGSHSSANVALFKVSSISNHYVVTLTHTSINNQHII